MRLWSYTLQVTSRNYEAEEDLGEALLTRGDQAEAMPHFYRATEIEPARLLPHMYIAVYDQEHGKLQEAIEQYKKAIGVTQNASANARAYANMGHAYLELGNPAQAVESLQEAVKLDPQKMETWLDLGLAKQKSGDSLRSHPGVFRRCEGEADGCRVSAVGSSAGAERASRRSGSGHAARSGAVRNFAEAQRVVERLVGQ